MGVSRIRETHITIKSDGPEETEVAAMKYWVGRKAAKKVTNRLLTLNGKRNQIAHGIAKIDSAGVPVFLPFFNFAKDFRYRSFTSRGPIPSIVTGVASWGVKEVRQIAEELRQGALDSLELVESLLRLFEDEK